MPETDPALAALDQGIRQAFAMVSQALGRATEALLHTDPVSAESVVADDQLVDDLTARLEQLAWQQIDAGASDPASLRFLVGALLIVPELERSGDLAEHVAQLALGNLGIELTPVCRGIVQRMTEVALEMWAAAADAYSDRAGVASHVNETDVELDILHERLSAQIAAEHMPATVAARVALLARFYERLGDHAVNVARRAEHLATGS